MVSLPPAGTTDIVARIVAQKLTEALGQTVIVDRPARWRHHHRQRGRRARGSRRISLLYSGSSLADHGVAPTATCRPDPVEDLIPIGPVGQSILRARGASGPCRSHSVRELISLAKSKPRQSRAMRLRSRHDYAPNRGTFPRQTRRWRLLHVPYKGGAPAILALVSGQVRAIFNPIAEILPHMRAGGKVRALAVTSPETGP